MAANDKDTIYIDIDDEITGVIDKLNASSGKIVALVLPKRAGVFQSIVNMKLLKRAADESKKHLVLITTEAGLLPLAGAAGIHVAKTLNSKPEIPVGPDAVDDSEDAVDEVGDEPEVTPETAGDKPVGELAGLGAAAAAADGVETIELDDDVLPEEEAAAVKPKSFDPPAAKKDKKMHVPNFERFRLLLVLGALLLILLIGGLIFALTALPKATISIKTDATSIPTDLNLNLSTTAKTLDTDNNTVPAKLAQQQKTYTQQIATTGQKNNGNKASGTVVFYNCDKSDVIFDVDRTVPSGTGISNNGQTYITQQSVDVPPSNFNPDGSCKNNHPSESINVVAQSPGTAYNLSGNSTFSVSYTNPGDGSRSFSAKTGSGISGGTDSIIQTVNQADINNAKSKIATDDSTVKQALQAELRKDGFLAILATYSPGTPVVTTSANVGDAATSVTVTEAVTYTMFGAQRDDLKTLVDLSVKDQIDTSKQSILSEGLDEAVFNVNTASATAAQLTMSVNATAGPDLDTNSIRQAAAGKKPADVKRDLTSNPDVTSVDVKLSPFWVSSVPKKTSKITVTIAKPTANKASSTNANNP